MITICKVLGNRTFELETKRKGTLIFCTQPNLKSNYEGYDSAA